MKVKTEKNSQENKYYENIFFNFHILCIIVLFQMYIKN